MNPIKVLSLFDGISGARLALQRAEIPVEFYFASEIDKFAIKVGKDNWPDIIHLGKVENIKGSSFKPDLVIGGTPCTNFSFAGKQNGMTVVGGTLIITLEQYLHYKEKGYEFEGQSYLFWEYIRILREIQKENPDVLFLLENTRMPQQWKDIISLNLGVQPIAINSALVSAQDRKRLYWTNIPGVTQPEDLKIHLHDVVLDGFVDRDKSHAIIGSIGRTTHREYLQKNQGQMVYDLSNLQLSEKEEAYMQRLNGGRSRLDRYANNIENNKSRCIITSYSKGVPYNVLIYQKPRSNNKGGYHAYKSPTITSSSWQENHHCVDVNKLKLRKLHVIEVERLQNYPDLYCKVVSRTQAYKALGNSFTIDVIAHILKFIIPLRRTKFY